MKNELNITAYGATDKGKVRDMNEDAIFYSLENGVFAVADGLGGLPNGEKASLCAIEVLKDKTHSDNMDLIQIFKDINEKIYSINKKSKLQDLGMGTTLTVGEISGCVLRIIHAGDSGVYKINKNFIKKITHDDTMERDFLERLEDNTHVEIPEFYKHTLTRCLGPTENIEFSIYEEVLSPGDRLLFFTDGLTKTIGEDIIQNEIINSSNPKTAVETFIQKANQLGGPDNIGLVAIFID